MLLVMIFEYIYIIVVTIKLFLKKLGQEYATVVKSITKQILAESFFILVNFKVASIYKQRSKVKYKAIKDTFIWK